MTLSSHLFRRIVSGYKIVSKLRAIEKPAEEAVISPPPAPEVQKIEIAKEKPFLEISGFEIPTRPKTFKIGALEFEEEKAPIYLAYPLIPRSPARGEPIFAYTRIFWDETTNRYLYQLVEPQLTEKLKEVYKKVKEILEQKLDIDFSKLKKIEAKQFLDRQIDDVLNYFNLTITANEKKILKYYMERDFMGLSIIEPLMRDPNLEDISCDGVGIPLFVFHRNPDISSIATDIMFSNADELDSFIIRLAQLCEKSISVAQPLLDGTLSDGSRVQATLGTDIARRGSNFSIRKFTEEPLTPVHLINYGTTDANTLAYLWFVVDYGRSILVSGGTATGKTSFLNVLSLFIRPEKKIVSIEDTAELKLPHIHWVPAVARTAIGAEGKGEVDMFELLRESLRQRPDYIVVGEVRGKEAYILFQQMASIPGYEKVLILNDNHLKRIPISKIKEWKNSKTFSVNPYTKKVEIANFTKFSHPPQKKLYKIKTRTGRVVITTAYHSLITLGKNGFETVSADKLRIGDEIAISAKLPSGLNDIEFLDLTELFPDIRIHAPELVKAAVKKLGFVKASKICKVRTISNYYGYNNCSLPLDKFKKIMKEARINYRLDKLKVKFERRATKSPAKLPITQEFLRLIGYYIAEGSLNTAKKNNSIQLYNRNEKILEDMRRCVTAVTNATIDDRITHGYSDVVELSFNHKTFFEFFKRFCGGRSENKKIPDFIFGLSKEKIGQFLTALYAGDGWFTKKDNKYVFGYSTKSKELADALIYLLLIYGIVATVNDRRKEAKNRGFEIIFYRRNLQEEFLKYVKPIGIEIKFERPSRENTRIIGDIFIDNIKEIETINFKKSQIVYDLSVSKHENFIGGFGGVLLHNTGHPSLATIHSENIDRLTNRLTTPPISLPGGLLSSLDIIVFLARMRYRNKFVRKVVEILEMVDFDPEKNKPIVNPVFRWNPQNDKFEIVGKSSVLKKIADATGVSEKDIKSEIERRILVIEWMKENNILDYRDVHKVFSLYYASPEKLLSAIQGAV